MDMFWKTRRKPKDFSRSSTVMTLRIVCSSFLTSDRSSPIKVLGQSPHSRRAMLSETSNAVQSILLNDLGAAVTHKNLDASLFVK